MRQGLFIAIEGSDGSGKGTQFKLLTERLRAEGFNVSTYDFPQYEKESAYYVKQYLNGAYGSAEELGPYTPSLFYALDRYSAAQSIAADLAAGKIVLSNRFSGSNMAHQGAKFNDKEERRMFFEWLDQLEFGMLQIPRPDQNIVLIVPAETAQKLVDQKATRNYTDKKRDIHEADINHLQQAVETYQQLCDTFPQNFTAIDCTQDGELMSIPAINNLIWERMEPMLGRFGRRKKKFKAAQSTQQQTVKNPYVTKNQNGSFAITPEGRAYLSEVVTNVDQDVYAFTDKISATTVAAAMARLSRRGDDMRVTLLDEFAQNGGKDEALLRRVITAYGDDSVQQLTGIHLVVENASNLLTKKLERGRLAAYLEQSTRYIVFDQKDEKGNFKYHTPTTLSDSAAKTYHMQMDTLFEHYSQLIAQLTQYVRTTSHEPENQRDSAWRAATRAQACDAARGVLPVATQSTVGIFASSQAVEGLIMRLKSDPLAESQAIGEALTEEARKVIPAFLQRIDHPDRGGAWIAYRAQTQANIRRIVADKKLQPVKGNGESVVLSDFWPKNELAALPHMLYQESTLSLNELEDTISSWSYKDKEATFKTYIGERMNRRHKPGRALETIHYGFDIICDYGIFRDLQRHRMVDALQWQALTPHYGFEIPKLVSQAGLDALFEECFEISLKLYYFLLENGYTEEAQYAVLLGHKMRFKLTLNAREAYHLIELRTSPQGHPGYRKLAHHIYEKIAQVHPLVAEGMRFVNKAEDPALTRLAAERAAQQKLERLNHS